jgi:hypothetical protein
VGANFIDQLGGATLPAPASKAAQNVPQQGLTTILSVSGILALLFPFIGGALGAHVGPESDKSAPTHPQVGTEISVMDNLQMLDNRCNQPRLI